MMENGQALDDLNQFSILYVEDEENIRSEVAYFLGRRAGCVLTAANGKEGLEEFLSKRPDLVLTDIQMPIMDGLAMAEEIKQRDRLTPVIFTTAFNDIQYLQRAIDLGADGYVLKPINLDQLMRTLMRAAEVLLQSREITISRAQLAAYHQAAEDERQLVADLMKRMMRPEKLRDHQVEHWLQPAEVIGGDLIAVARSRNDKLYVMLADSTGHGLPAALNLLPINHIFYRMVTKNLPVSLIVEEMNWAVREQSPTERYVAALIACIESRNRVVEIWNGGLPPALFIGRDGTIMRTFSSSNFPLGILDRTFTAQTEIFQWPQPGHLVAYSDGLEDAEDEAGRPFGSERIVGILQESAAEQRFDALVGALKAYLGPRAPFDDITLVVAASERPEEATPH